MQRPSLLLWRHRHLVVAVCLGTAVLVALSLLRPGPAQGRRVIVAASQVGAGVLITERDVTESTLPTSALPQSGLATKEQVVGTRAAVTLEPGTVLTVSMTSGGMAQELGADERLVQVPVEVGAELARPGARVDVIGQTGDGWSRIQNEAQNSGSRSTPDGDGHSQGEDAPYSESDYGSTTPSTSSSASPSASSPEQESSGRQEPSQSSSQEMPPGPLGQRSAVLCSGARVVMTQQAGEDGHWTTDKKVTLITLAIPAGSAILVVGAATNSTLGIVLSP